MSTSILDQTTALARVHPLTLCSIALEANIDKGFVYNWSRHGAQITKVEAVLSAIGYRLEIVPLKRRTIR